MTELVVPSTILEPNQMLILRPPMPLDDKTVDALKAAFTGSAAVGRVLVVEPGFDIDVVITDDPEALASAVTRVAAFVERRAEMVGLDPDLVHAVGDRATGEPIELLLSDLRRLLAVVAAP